MKRVAWAVLISLLICGLNAAGQAPQNRGLQKQFVYRVRPVRVEMIKSPTEKENAIAEEHFNYLKELNAKGVVILAGKTLTTDESTFGIVIFHADSEDAARRIMEGDPGVRKGIFKAEVFPFRVVLMENTQGK
ncbi:MAG TPA: YciI family protein [Terriglobia bacterium]|nr:YciI family protein [Terriglobia bacterium]